MEDRVKAVEVIMALGFIISFLLMIGVVALVVVQIFGRI